MHFIRFGGIKKRRRIVGLLEVQPCLWDAE